VKENFWDQINKEFAKEVNAVMTNCLMILSQGFHANFEEISEFKTQFTNEIRDFTKQYISKMFRDINTNVLRRFKTEFEKDENGQLRNWVAMEEQ
jgi:hypothetical protein